MPIAVNVVPGDEASGRIPDPTVTTEVAFQEAQHARRNAAEALRRGDTDAAARMLGDAGDALYAALPTAPAMLAGDVSAEAAELKELADRAGWDDSNRVAKANYSSWHAATRRRGRPRPPKE